MVKKNRIEQTVMTSRQPNIGFHNLRVYSMVQGPATQPIDNMSALKSANKYIKSLEKKDSTFISHERRAAG